MTVKGFKFLTPWGTMEGRSTGDQRYADSQYNMAEYRQSREEAEAKASAAAAMIAINREALKHELALMIYNAAITSGNN